MLTERDVRARVDQDWMGGVQEMQVAVDGQEGWVGQVYVGILVGLCMSATANRHGRYSPSGSPTSRVSLHVVKVC